MSALDILITTTSLDISLPDADSLYAQAQDLVDLASEQGVSIGTAESCTGGLVSGSITAISGSSAVMLGGIVSYALSAKVALLGVAQKTLDTCGAVSRECALQMSEGTRRALGCDIAVSITGIAGPTGAVPGKPVGTVWFSVATPHRSVATRRLFTGTRDEVRSKSTSVALALLSEAVKETSSLKA